MSLTAKQQKFVDEYLKCFNATEAARLAGYKATNGSLANIGWENVRKREIAEKIKQHFEASAMSSSEVVSRIADIARDGKKPSDRLRALELAGKVHGIFSDNIVVKLEQELSSMLDHLQSSLDSETYQKVLDVIASASQSGEA